MSQTSCIRRLPKTKFVILREEFLAIADNNNCAAQLLHLFEFWTNGKIAEQQRIRQYNQVAAKADSPLLRDEGLWLYESIQNIQKGLLDSYSEKTIRNSLKFLESSGFIKTKPSNIAWDRTKYYLLQIKAVNAALDKWDKERQQEDMEETSDLPEPKTPGNIEPVNLPQETVKLPLEAVELPLEVEILPSLLYIKEVDLISRSKEHTPPNPLKGKDTLADETPAPHPSVCVASQSEKTNQEVNRDPNRVDHPKNNTARTQDLNLGLNSVAASKISTNTQNHKKRRNTQSLSQGKWHCPGAAEERLEFLRWKGSLLVAAGKTSKAEAESAALAWANRHSEEASLAYEGWKRELNKEKNSTLETALQVIAEIPDFSIKPKAWHEELIKAYHREGEEAFLGRENWYKDWLKFAKTYLTQQLKKGQGGA